jgi:ribosomal protein S18 acetylase RimI-like enzyme
MATLRKATGHDAEQLGAVHVAAWKETYTSLLPEEMLSALTVEHRSAMWAHILANPAASDDTVVFLAEDQGTIIGFGACGRQRDERLSAQGFDAEIGAIYVLRSHQHQGIGQDLMRAMAAELQSRGFTAVALWVLRENAAARRFYQHLGGEIVGEKEDQRGDTTLVEAAYGWRGWRGWGLNVAQEQLL